MLLVDERCLQPDLVGADRIVPVANVAASRELDASSSKFADFEIMSRSRSVAAAIGNRDDLERLAVGLLEAAMPLPKAVRLLGVSRSSLQEDQSEVPQLDLPI
jgi:hypothetical protein